MTARRFLADDRGASAAEFALVLPAALLMLFGVIDVGTYAWVLNEYEKATQMGARYAVVTDVISPALLEESYIDYDCGGQALNAGDRICSESLGSIVCSRAGCECDDEQGTCPSGTLSPPDSVVIDRVITQMQRYQPRIAPGSVRVEYRGSGIGYAGDPSKPEIAPIVTVRVVDATYQPIVLSPFGGGTVPLPDFSYSLTMEDGQGTVSG
jgi:Flp pilus assembly pilin Flp